MRAALVILCCLQWASAAQQAPATSPATATQPAAHDLAARAAARLNLAQLTRQAERGNLAAQTELGRRLLLGQGVKARPNESLTWFGKAAAAGSGDALFELYLCFRDGAGSEPRNPEKAEKLLNASAARGHPRALVVLAEREIAAEVPSEASAAAAQRLVELARGGSDDACLALGRAIAQRQAPAGSGDAIQLLLKAAASEDPRVSLASARVFRDGLGNVRADNERAALLLRRLAEKGVREANIDLARLSPETYRGVAREQSIERVHREERLIGTSVQVEGELISSDNERWTIRQSMRGPSLSVIPDAPAVEHVRNRRYVRVCGLVEAPGLVRALLVEVPEPKYQVFYTLTEPKILKGTHKQSYIVDGEIRNVGRQDIDSLKLRIRVFQPESGVEDVEELTIAELPRGQARPFTVAFRPDDVRAPQNVSPVSAEAKVTDVQW